MFYSSKCLSASGKLKTAWRTAAITVLGTLQKTLQTSHQNVTEFSTIGKKTCQGQTQKKQMLNNFQKTLKKTLHKFKMESQLETTEGSKAKQGRCKMKSEAKGQICQSGSFKYNQGRSVRESAGPWIFQKINNYLRKVEALQRN